MSEAYFIVHVYPDGRREVIEVTQPSITLERRPIWDPWARPFAYADPGPLQVRLSGYMNRGVIYDPNQDPDFTPAERQEIEAPRPELDSL